MHPDRAVGLLWGMPQLPRLLGFLDAAVVDEAVIIIIIKRLQWLLHRGVGQEHRFASRAVVPPMSLMDHHPMDRVGLKVAVVMRPPVLRRAILVIRGQPGG